MNEFRAWWVAAVVLVGGLGFVSAGSPLAPELTDPAGDVYDEFLGAPQSGPGTLAMDILAAWFTDSETNLSLHMQMDDLASSPAFRETRTVQMWSATFNDQDAQYSIVVVRDHQGASFAALDVRGAHEVSGLNTDNGGLRLRFDDRVMHVTMPRTWVLDHGHKTESISMDDGEVLENLIVEAFDGRGDARTCVDCVRMDFTAPGAAASYEIETGSAGPVRRCGTIAHQSSQAWSDDADTRTMSRAATIPPGENQTLIVSVVDQHHDAGVLPSVSFGGANLSLAVAAEQLHGDHSEPQASVWYLSNPPAGTATLSVHWPERVHEWVVAAEVYSASNQTSPIGAVTGQVGYGQFVNFTVDTQFNGSAVLGIAAIDEDDATFSHASRHIVRFQADAGDDLVVYGAEQRLARAGAAAFSFDASTTVSESDRNVGVGVELRSQPCQAPDGGILDPRFATWVLGIVYICVDYPPPEGPASCM